MELYDQKKSENSHLLCSRSCCPCIKMFTGINLECRLTVSENANASRLKRWNKQLNLNYMILWKSEAEKVKKSENQKIHTYFARDLVALALRLRCSLGITGNFQFLDVDWPSLKMNANRLKQWNKQLNLNYMILWKSEAEKVKKSENSNLLCSRSCCPCIKMFTGINFRCWLTISENKCK